MANSCKVCGGTGALHRLQVREMLKGTREQFEYVECASCGSLQICEVPTNLASYYDSYYSMQGPEPWLKRSYGPISVWMRAQRSSWSLARVGLVGRVLEATLGPANLGSAIAWLRQTRTLPHERILDVGCGAGELLHVLRNEGFSDLHGCDPYLTETVALPGLSIRKQPRDDLWGSCDLVMAHHSLEHMPEPADAISMMRRLLTEDGRLLLRLPVAGGAVYREFGANWVQLDAPRHLVIPSERGLSQLLERCGFRIQQVVYDSSAFQFWGSQHYADDIALSDPVRSWANRQNRSAEVLQVLARQEKRARALNQARDGDQACFFAVPANEDH